MTIVIIFITIINVITIKTIITMTIVATFTINKPSMSSKPSPFLLPSPLTLPLPPHVPLAVINFSLKFRCVLHWVPEVFSYVRRGASTRLWPKTRIRRSSEKKSSGAERLDLPCYMDLDLVSNLSIKPAVAEPNVFRAGHILGLIRNRKPRMKSLLHPG